MVTILFVRFMFFTFGTMTTHKTFRFTHHMIQETSTMVASLKELKNLMRISPSSPSFLKATPNTMANTTRPRMFMPSWSAPWGTCRPNVHLKKKKKIHQKMEITTSRLHKVALMIYIWTTATRRCSPSPMSCCHPCCSFQTACMWSCTNWTEEFISFRAISIGTKSAYADISLT